MEFNIEEEKEEDEYEVINLELKKHIYNIIKHINIKNNNIDDDIEKINHSIDNIFNIICETQILKNTIHENKNINEKNFNIYTDLLCKGKYGYNKIYYSEEEALNIAE